MCTWQIKLVTIGVEYWKGGRGGAEGARAPREILLRGSAPLEILQNFLQSNAVTSKYT
jgi:hypothetical protein